MKALVSLVLVLACQAAPSPQDVSSTLSDGEACVVGILATASGTPDLADLLRCGMTAADVWALISKLERASASDASAALSPAQVAWRAKLEGVKAQIRLHDGGPPHTSGGK